MGVDATDLVITNGLRIWQRSMPIGGNNFTKALVQGLKLTFAKAEQLKRNAARADNAKDVFNAMKPVFNEFASGSSARSTILLGRIGRHGSARSSSSAMPRSSRGSPTSSASS